MSFRTHTASGSSGAIATTIAPGLKWELHEVRIHLDAAGSAGSFTATMDSGRGSKYDTLVYSKSMGSVQDLVKTFNPPLRFNNSADQVDIAYANGGSAAYGVEAIYKILY